MIPTNSERLDLPSILFLRMDLFLRQSLNKWTSSESCYLMVDTSSMWSFLLVPPQHHDQPVTNLFVCLLWWAGIRPQAKVPFADTSRLTRLHGPVGRRDQLLSKQGHTWVILAPTPPALNSPAAGPHSHTPSSPVVGMHPTVPL